GSSGRMVGGLAAALLVACWCADAGEPVDVPAQDPVEGPADLADLEEIVVTARRRGTREFDTSRGLSFVDSLDIRDQGAVTSPDAIADEPGVWVQKTGFGGGAPFIRGLTGKQVLMLIDGMRFSNSTVRGGPNQYLNTIDPSVIDRIEIVRGPGSVLYGSDALGGVINVVTDRGGRFGEAPEPGSSGMLGEQYSSAAGSSVTRAQIDVGRGNVGYRVGAGYKYFDDLRAGDGAGPMGVVDVDGRQPGSGYDELDLNASLRWVVSDESELRAAVLFTRQNDVPRTDKVLPSTYNTSPDERYFYDPQQLVFGYVEYERRDEATKGVLKANASFNNWLEGRERRKAGATSISYWEDDVRTVGASLQAGRGLGERRVVTAGIEFYHDAIRSGAWDVADTGAVTPGTVRFADGTSYSSLGIYVQDEVELGERFDVTVGGRYSSSTVNLDFDGLTIIGAALTMGPLYEYDMTYSDATWSVEGVYHASESVNVYAAVSRGFRAPNVDDVGVYGDWSSGYDVPNPDLDAEELVNYEVGLKYAGERAEFGLSYSFADYTDMLARRYVDPGADATPDTGDDLYQWQNTDEAEMRTFELWAKAGLASGVSGDWSLFGNFTWTKGDNTTDNEPLRRIPPPNGILGLRWDGRAKRRWSELYMVAAAEQDRLSQGDVADKLRIPPGGTPGWATLNIRGGMMLSESLTLTLGACNLTDKRYRIHGSGLDAPGRGVSVGIEWVF
ncbi:MAG: TonB-dependent receptor plug domain-containing protein, partial [Planctomycetota bacterium]